MLHKNESFYSYLTMNFDEAFKHVCYYNMQQTPILWLWHHVVCGIYQLFTLYKPFNLVILEELSVTVIYRVLYRSIAEW